MNLKTTLFTSLFLIYSLFAFCQNNGVVNIGLNVKTISFDERISLPSGDFEFSPSLTTVGPEISVDYAILKEFLSVSGQFGVNFAENENSDETFTNVYALLGVNFSPGKSLSGLYAGPRIGFRSDNQDFGIEGYDTDPSAMYGFGAGIILFPQNKVSFGIYGDYLLDEATSNDSYNFGFKVGYRFAQ